MVFVPIAITFNTFHNTRNTYRTVPTATGSVSRTAWAKDTKSWPTTMYFVIALVSMSLNLLIMVAYLRGVRVANRAATISTGFDWLVIGINLGVWLAAVAIYRLEKDKNGVHNDLWGWSCSDAAAKVQDSFDGVLNFGKLCNVQVRHVFPTQGAFAYLL
jgi:hypothetical protein